MRRPLRTIPQEIIGEILSRVPAKPLLKFKCVCKSWLTLISSSQFVKTHLNVLSKSNYLANHSLVLVSHASPKTFFTCPLPSFLTDSASINPTNLDFPKRISRIVGTCNGLLCVSARGESLTLCNPTTRKFKNLMLQKNVAMQTTSYGFCYDKLNDDYKVVLLLAALKDGTGYKTNAKVYSLRGDYWRDIDGLDGGTDDACKDGICVGGMIHWSWFLNPDGFRFITSLNIATYEYGVVLLPEYDKTACDHFHWSLGEFGGCLGVICDYSRVIVDIWVMKEYGVKESWFKLVSIPYSEDPHSYISHIFESGNDEFIFNYYPNIYHHYSNVMLYNSRNFSMRKLDICSGVRDSLVVFAPPYIETLVPLSLEG